MYVIILALIPALFITSCKKDMPEIVAGNSYSILAAYMEANDLDLPDMLTDWITTAENVNTNIANYYVFDLRNATDFGNGHITGAINVTLGNLLTTAESYTDKPIVVACYTGQTAGHAVMALRLSGYADAVVLKWGMAGWNSTLSAPWTGNLNSTGVGHASWVTTASPATSTYGTPEWTSTSTDGASILAERIDVMLAGGLVGTLTSSVLTDPSQYQIFNYWGETDYLGDGHFVGAFQYKNINLASNGVAAINPDGNALVYCYTGQTSSMITAWLNVLGYNALSGKFGANGVIYDGMSSHKFVASSVVDLPLVTN